jgi:hypothetical protein
MICCDTCDTWFHQPCVDLTPETVPEGNYVCPRCQNQTSHPSESIINPGKEEVSDDDLPTEEYDASPLLIERGAETDTVVTEKNKRKRAQSNRSENKDRKTKPTKTKTKNSKQNPKKKKTTSKLTIESFMEQQSRKKRQNLVFDESQELCVVVPTTPEYQNLHDLANFVGIYFSEIREDKSKVCSNSLLVVFYAKKDAQSFVENFESEISGPISYTNAVELLSLTERKTSQPQVPLLLFDLQYKVPNIDPIVTDSQSHPVTSVIPGRPTDTSCPAPLSTPVTTTTGVKTTVTPVLSGSKVTPSCPSTVQTLTTYPRVAVSRSSSRRGSTPLNSKPLTTSNANLSANKSSNQPLGHPQKLGKRQTFSTPKNISKKVIKSKASHYESKKPSAIGGNKRMIIKDAEESGEELISQSRGVLHETDRDECCLMMEVEGAADVECDMEWEYSDPDPESMDCDGSRDSGAPAPLSVL